MNEDRPRDFAGARRLVVKIGSATLRDGAGFDRVSFVSLVRDLIALRGRGIEAVVVCSGAVALGLSRLGWARRPERIELLQAAAAVGQGRLMRHWADELGAYQVVAAQVLLTHDDLRDRRRFLAARHTLRALLEVGAVPVVNENDTVAFDELKLGDNDLLSSHVVSLVEGSALVILSDVEALYDKDPRAEGARPLRRVARVDASVLAAAGDSASGLGSGGMRTKIAAVRQVNRLGVPAVVAHGKTPRILQRLADGEALGTWFDPEPSTMGSRKHWIAFAQPPCGEVHVDAGAARALAVQGRSLLPIGVTAVVGDFDVGEAVRVLGPDGAEVARGLANHPSAILRKVAGQRSDHAAAHLASAPEVIHRDDLVLSEG